MLKGAQSIDDVRSGLSSIKSNQDYKTAITGSIYRPMVVADFGGQLFVNTFELSDKVKKKAPIKKLRNVNTPAFLRMPFDEAVKAYEQMYGSNEKVRDIIAGYRNRASAVSTQTLDQLALQVETALQSTLTNGGTLESFQQQFANSGMSTGYIETVYRTNLGTAYGAGRVREIERVIDVVPYVQYRTAQDVRVRESHAVLDGKVFDTRSAQWQDIAPPNGFNCRCGMVVIDPEDIEGEVLGAVPNELPNANGEMVNTKPDPGFFGSPAEIQTNFAV